MANTPREETSYIVLGVDKHADNSFDLVGLTKQIDGNDLQTQSVDRVHPVPCFSYVPVNHGGKSFGVIVIPPIRQGPCMLRNDFGTFLKQRQVFLRRDSTNVIALPDDIMRIATWIKGNQRGLAAGGGEEYPGWHDFLQVVQNSDPTRHYFLIAGPLAGTDLASLSGLGPVPWTAVFDFDPNSETNGLLKTARSPLETQRSPQLVVLGERPTINPGRSTYWFFARGLAGRDRSIEVGPWLPSQLPIPTAPPDSAIASVHLNAVS